MNVEDKLSSMEAYEKSLLKMSWINLIGLSLMLIWICIAIFVLDSVNIASASLAAMAIVPGMTSLLAKKSMPSAMRKQTNSVIILIGGFFLVMTGIIFLRVYAKIQTSVYVPILIAAVIGYIVLLLVMIFKMKKKTENQQFVDERMEAIQKKSFQAGLTAFFISMVTLVSIVPSTFSYWLMMNKGAFMLLFWVSFICMFITQSASFIIMHKKGE